MRFNIVPETVEMTGTIRTYDAQVRSGVHRDIRQVAENIAASANAKAEVEIIELYDPLVNNDKMTARMTPVLMRAADNDAGVVTPSGAAEDFSFFLNEVPGLFFLSAWCHAIKIQPMQHQTTVPISMSMKKR